MREYTKRIDCAGCDNSNLKTILNLGRVPFVGEFPTEDELDRQTRWNLRLVFCDECKLVQTDSLIDPQVAFKNYKYLSSVSLSKHFNEVANIIDKKYNVRDKHILEIGCNDGVLLEPLSKLGAVVDGVDPSEKPVEVARQKGLNIYNEFFGYETFKDFENKYDLVSANNSFAHIIDVQNVIKGIKNVLRTGGYFIFEVHYLKSIIDGKQWDNVYHEHIYYYSLSALNNMFKRYNMTIVDFEEIPIHSGSIRVTVVNDNIDLSDKIQNRLELESKTIANIDYLKKYRDDVRTHVEDFNKQLKELSKEYTIAGYGASGRAGIFCSMTGLDENIVKFIVDESPERCGRYLSGTKIPIVEQSELQDTDVNLLIIFAWNYSKMIIDKTFWGFFKYLVAFPTVQLVNNYDELEGFDSI